MLSSKGGAQIGYLNAEGVDFMRHSVVVMEELNIDYAGEIWDGDNKYEMIIISQFDKSDKEVMRKVFYVKGRFDLTLSQARFMIANYPNCSKLRVNNSLLVRN